jgi:uncharacterized protein YdeI (YjbR/CyaY-like superfamily)
LKTRPAVSATKSRPETLSFDTPREWERWLSKNFRREEGIWLRFFKKVSGVPSVTYDEALDVALCYGWIDGQLKPFDARSWLRKFTPRRPKSPWSKRNIDHVSRLTKAGRMKPAGLEEVRAARADGRWESSYPSVSAMTIPADFYERLSKIPKAKKGFESLSKRNLYAIAWRLQTAKKPETRERRLKEILALLARGEKLLG